MQALRRRFGVVLQDPFLFSGTIETNIRLGSEDVDLAAVERAAEEVNLSEFIRSLPDGFQSHIRERGSTLSTGQKQLISFARALAHNPKILILDEATSSVDTDTEFRVREALSHMVEGRTSLIIAHRLSTIQRADNIIVMHKGKVREMGTHQQLLAQRGIYYKLYQLQYRDQELTSVPVPPPLAAPSEFGAGVGSQTASFGKSRGGLSDDFQGTAGFGLLGDHSGAGEIGRPVGEHFRSQSQVEGARDESWGKGTPFRAG